MTKYQFDETLCDRELLFESDNPGEVSKFYQEYTINYVNGKI